MDNATTKEDKVKGIYYIKNKVTNTMYIGSSNNIKNRMRNHFNKLINNKHINYLLQNEFNMYGYLNYEFGILEECDAELTTLELKNLESKFIKHYAKEMKMYNRSDPSTESINDVNFPVTTYKDKQINKRMTNISNKFIDWYLYSKFHTKLKQISNLLANKHLYISKEKLDKFFMSRIDNEDVKNDYRIQTRLDSTYSNFNLYKITALKFRREFYDLYSVDVSNEFIIYVHKDVYAKLIYEKENNFAILHKRDKLQVRHKKVSDINNKFKDLTDEELNDYAVYLRNYGITDRKYEKANNIRINNKRISKISSSNSIKSKVSDEIMKLLDEYKAELDSLIIIANKAIYYEDVEDKMGEILKDKISKEDYEYSFTATLQRYIRSEYRMSIINIESEKYCDEVLKYLELQRKGFAILTNCTFEDIKKIMN